MGITLTRAIGFIHMLPMLPGRAYQINSILTTQYSSLFISFVVSRPVEAIHQRRVRCPELAEPQSRFFAFSCHELSHFFQELPPSFHELPRSFQALPLPFHASPLRVSLLSHD